MSEKKAKIIKVENKIQKKAGYGEISEQTISRAESVILNNTADFKEIAIPILSRLKDVLASAKSNPDDIEHITQDIIRSVMELKANGAIFKYNIVGKLAEVMLSFLEHLLVLNTDALDIIDAHQKTLSLIVSKEIKGDGGALGKQLLNELESACARYYRKNPDKFKNYKV